MGKQARSEEFATRSRVGKRVEGGGEATEGH